MAVATPTGRISPTTAHRGKSSFTNCWPLSEVVVASIWWEPPLAVRLPFLRSGEHHFPLRAWVFEGRNAAAEAPRTSGGRVRHGHGNRVHPPASAVRGLPPPGEVSRLGGPLPATDAVPGIPLCAASDPAQLRGFGLVATLPVRWPEADPQPGGVGQTG